MTRTIVAVLLGLWLLAGPAQAVLPDEMLEDPVLEKRARTISASLRCLVCQNQSIDDSDAPLARDLRILLRERLVAGDSDLEAVNFLVARYGEFILLKPRFSARTALLWFGPFLVVLIGLFVVRRTLRPSPRAAALEGDLSAEEADKVAELLQPGDGGTGSGDGGTGSKD